MKKQITTIEDIVEELLENRSIKLFNSDLQFLNSIYTTKMSELKPLTENQSKKALRLSKKYKKQFEKVTNFDIEDVVENNVFRITPKKAITHKIVYIEDNKIIIQTPYIEELIKDIKAVAQSRTIPNRTVWDGNKQIWILDLNRNNALHVAKLATDYFFDFVDETIIEYVKKITEADKYGYPRVSLVENELLYEGLIKSQYEFVEKYGSSIENLKNEWFYYDLQAYGIALDLNLKNYAKDIIKVPEAVDNADEYKRLVIYGGRQTFDLKIISLNQFKDILLNYIDVMGFKKVVHVGNSMTELELRYKKSRYFEIQKASDAYYLHSNFAKFNEEKLKMVCELIDNAEFVVFVQYEPTSVISKYIKHSKRNVCSYK